MLQINKGDIGFKFKVMFLLENFVHIYRRSFHYFFFSHLLDERRLKLASWQKYE